MRDFLFVELQEGKPVEVLRPGTFTDRNGKEVAIAPADLDAFVTNFQAGAAGQEVPVDVNHEKDKAAGWISQLRREGDRLLAVIDWNSLGTELIKDRLYRYVSAFIDMERKVIKSISLVNFPAVKGLAPVELSEGVYALQETAHMGVIDAIIQQLQGVREALAQWVGSPPEVEEAELVIREEGGRYCLYTSDGRRKIACHATREEALRQERAIQVRKHGGMSMEEAIMAELQRGRIENIISAWSQWAGSYTRCVSQLRGKEGISNPEALCAWLHHRAEGKWPAEGGELEDKRMARIISYPDFEPTDDEIEAIVRIVQQILSGGDEMTDQERAQLRKQLRTEIEAEMAEERKRLTDLREEVKKEVEVELRARVKREAELKERVDRLTNGDGAALSAKAQDVMTWLVELTEPQQEAALRLLESKIVDFGEAGSGRKGKPNRKQLPPEYATALDQGQLTLTDLSNPILELEHPLAEYDLSKWQK